MSSGSQATDAERLIRSRHVRRLVIVLTAVVVPSLLALALVIVPPSMHSAPRWVLIASAVGAAIVLCVLLVAALLLPGWIFERRVARLRPDSAAVALAGTADSVVALRAILSSFDTRMTMVASIGPERVSIWGRWKPAPDLEIAYDAVRRIWVDAAPIETGTRRQARVRLWSTVVIEVTDGNGILHRVPLVPIAYKLTRNRDAGVERLVDALSTRTALPWLDAARHD